MRLLLDESVPRRFGRLLPGHDVRTVTRMGWHGVANGELLRRAAATFDALLTVDRGLEHQQNLTTLPLAVVVLVAPSNKFESLQPLAGAVLSALETLRPRTVIRIG